MWYHLIKNTPKYPNYISIYIHYIPLYSTIDIAIGIPSTSSQNARVLRALRDAPLEHGGDAVEDGAGPRRMGWTAGGTKNDGETMTKEMCKIGFSCRNGEHGKVLGILLPNWCFPTFLFGNVLENRLFSAKQNGWTGVNGTATDWNLECLHVSQNDLSPLLECFEKQFWIVFWIGCDIQLEFWSIVFFGLAANWFTVFCLAKKHDEFDDVFMI